MTLSYAEACWWQRLPACLAEGGHAILVTVARADGSTPRERGASMLVEATRCTDTVGGGNLEFEAIRVARAMLAGETRQPMVRYTLGPGLRQCCGGAVWLLYEAIAPDAANARAWALRCAALTSGERLLRSWTADSKASDWRLLFADEMRETGLASRDGLHWQQVVGETRFAVRLFGAGHVGRALARMLAMTDAHLQWIDPRPEARASAQAIGLPLRLEDDPVDAVLDAPAGTWFIIMSHSHTLDFELVEAVLRRRDARFCGVIGSATKGARFRHNLRLQGLDAATIAGLCCPLGVKGIHDKAPASIAVSIMAQLLQLREADCVQSAPVLPSEVRSSQSS